MNKKRAEREFWIMMLPHIDGFTKWLKRTGRQKNLDSFKLKSFINKRRRKYHALFWTTEVEKINMDIVKEYISFMNPIELVTFALRLPKAIQLKLKVEIYAAEAVIELELEAEAA